MDQRPGRRRRRTHSAEFKAEAVAACHKPDASIAACALERSINANLLRRWVIEAEKAQTSSVVPGKPMAPIPRESFVALPMPAQPAPDEAPIRIELRRGSMTLTVQWPRSAVHECALWLREVLQ
jgi:transposase